MEVKIHYNRSQMQHRKLCRPFPSNTRSGAIYDNDFLVGGVCLTSKDGSPALLVGLRPPRFPGTEKKIGSRGEVDCNFGENLGLRRKSRIKVKISDWMKNFGFRWKFRIFLKVSNLRNNLELRRKSRTQFAMYYNSRKSTTWLREKYCYQKLHPKMTCNLTSEISILSC